MTENAFYPIFLCVALALVRMLEAPTARNQLGVLALCLVAYETRQQALALFPAVLTAPLLLGRRGLGRFRVLYGAVGAVRAARGRRRGGARANAARAPRRVRGDAAGTATRSAPS